ncbi:MAG: hypothetical protein RLZZ324_269 [Candidatus Parcubacteria bacterium]|jgi:hypothetical protein
MEKPFNASDLRIEWFSSAGSPGYFGIYHATKGLVATVQTQDEHGLAFILALAPQLHEACVGALKALEHQPGNNLVVGKLRTVLNQIDACGTSKPKQSS